MPDRDAYLRHHFADMDQQREASNVGMWIFLATEVMFFGGLFTAYGMLRYLHAPAFIAAGHHSSFLLGSLNTAVLLTSSLFMALAVHAARRGERGWILRFLGLTMVLGSVFLLIKGVEYSRHFHHGLFPGPGFEFEEPLRANAQLFFYLYFATTGLHALHMVVGIGLLAVMAFLAWRGAFSADYYTPVEMSGLYWHFVDIIWIFLFPMFYLIGGH